MNRPMRRGLSVVACILGLTSCHLFEGGNGDGDWNDLFDGKSLAGWKASESGESWSVVDGHLVAHGTRSHLYYMGDPEPFVNFELEAVIMTQEHSNSGVYFHTQFQEEGWPKYGFEAQVNNSYHDPQKTGSLYGVVKNLEAPAKDNQWFTMRLRVEGRNVLITVDGKTVVDYLEPEDAVAGEDFTRKLAAGTFALQAHDPESVVHYKSIRVRRLPAR